MKLSELQQEFVAALQNSPTEKMLTNIPATPKLSAEKQFSIYQNSILGRFQKTLMSTYAVCYKLVGHDFFMRMANHYIATTVSDAPDLSFYGKTFPHCIADYPPAQVLPYLSDVAKLEWAWHSIYQGSDDKPFDFERLAETYKTSPETIQFTLPTNAILLSSFYPIHQIWETNQEEYQGETIITLKDHSHYYLLVWRKGLERHIETLTYSQWQILSWLQSHLTVAELCDKIDQLPNSESIDKTLTEFVRKGWIANFQM